MTTEVLLRGILSMTARIAIPPKELPDILMPKGGTEAQLEAYNMCDGTRSQSEIARALNLDTGNFSRTVARWGVWLCALAMAETPNSYTCTRSPRRR